MVSHMHDLVQDAMGAAANTPVPLVFQPMLKQGLVIFVQEDLRVDKEIMEKHCFPMRIMHITNVIVIT